MRASAAWRVRASFSRLTVSLSLFQANQTTVSVEETTMFGRTANGLLTRHQGRVKEAVPGPGKRGACRLLACDAARDEQCPLNPRV